ncbi:response regulator [uncultured Desulfosarcina sp.]|uniref:hybrid sensor histidine kinase/response regulator n=1 Tax=uncultured Desulfosarcina sp. TaxID=218289 RepID=UPI0029C6B67D|nr:response regulator [uncultured Desulfosarcina sp.]
MTTADQWPVLIVDDEKDIRDVTALTLMDAGYVVETAADGIEGLALCEQFAPRIVITDIRMPGMNGIQVLETIKQRYPDTEVIVATAFGEMETAIRALQLDASDFITKPIHTEAMMVALERARHRYTTRQQLKDYTRHLEKGLSLTTRQLEETVAFQDRLIESSMDGILGCDGSGKVIAFNRSMERMLGFGRTEVLHQAALEHFFSPAEYHRFQDDLAASGHGGPNRLMLYETCLQDYHKKPVPVQLSATVLMEEAQSAGLVCFFRDLRRIHRLEQEMADQARLLHQDKMMSLGRLAASVAHEINNPLSGILNYIRLMLRAFKKGPLPADRHAQFARYLALVETETDRCSKIVSSLLTFSRRSPVSVGPVSINEILDRSLVLARHRLELGNISLVTRIADHLPEVSGDASQLQQCLLNLIFNAVDAMSDGGTLTLNATSEENAKTVVIQVTDTGIGIRAEDMAHIFEPFYTTKQEGHGIGLGLSTTYGIIDRHGGSLTAASQSGHGSTFEIRLPVQAPIFNPPGGAA